MPIFFLIRHAENEFITKKRLAGRLPDIHLNENGRAQAQAVAAMLETRLKNAAIKAVYSSPLERAIETAEPIASVFNVEIIPRPGLIETDCGKWQGKTIKQLKRRKLWRMVQDLPSQMRFPNGETFAETQQRICSEIEALRAQHNDKEVVICISHSDPIKLAIAHYIGLPLDMFQKLTIAPASITALSVSESGSRLLNMNIDIAPTMPPP